MRAEEIELSVPDGRLTFPRTRRIPGNGGDHTVGLCRSCLMERPSQLALTPARANRRPLIKVTDDQQGGVIRHGPRNPLPSGDTSPLIPAPGYPADHRLRRSRLWWPRQPPPTTSAHAPRRVTAIGATMTDCFSSVGDQESCLIRGCSSQSRLVVGWDATGNLNERVRWPQTPEAPASCDTLASPSLASYTASSVLQSVSIRCQNTGEGQRFRVSH